MSGSNVGNTSRNANQRLADQERRRSEHQGDAQRRGSGARPAPPPQPDGGAGSGAAPGRAPTPAALACLPNKHLLLEVPNFNSAEDPALQMGSYLRLGSVPDPSIAGQPDAPPATGEDLASYANVGHLDDHVTEFLDDERKRDGCPDFVSIEDRKSESAILHTKGGWRDHSDGNRITTTRGDKIEVIRGNYKMVVLGRQEEPGGGAGWDVSGGHIEGLHIRSSIEWVQTWDGTWKTVEKSEKGDTDVTQHGNNVSRNFGDLMDNTTGSEDEMRPTFDAEDNFVKMVPAANPVIRDRTWARAMESYTGSSGRRVPSIASETWAKKLTSKTDVHEMSDDTQVLETMTSETKVGGLMSNTTLAGAMLDTTIAAKMMNINIADMTNINIGNNANITIGPTENVNIGATIDLTIAAMLQVCLSAGVSINLGPKADYTFPETVNLSPSKSEVTGESTSVSGVTSYVSGVYKVTAGMILLG
jgi:hypothetical protein